MNSGGLILSVSKPAGWTSFDVVAKLRKMLCWKKVGHAGTLDPMAEGVLIILCGDATRRADEFMNLSKEYRATIRLGITTSTDDITGEVLETCAINNWSEELIREQLAAFCGVIQQLPPSVSAIKIGGKRSYKMTFAGHAPHLEERPVNIYGIDIHGFSLPDVDLTIRCSRGTYIRSIARDLGNKLHWGGTLASLTRTAVGPYRIERSLSMDAMLRHQSEFTFTS
jgi:tRNA pseudouridine55 synthase